MKYIQWFREIVYSCEIPKELQEEIRRRYAVLIDDFSKIFDGFSIGSNDLPQLTLGVDCDREIVAFDYDEVIPGCSR